MGTPRWRCSQQILLLDMEYVDQSSRDRSEITPNNDGDGGDPKICVILNKKEVHELYEFFLTWHLWISQTKYVSAQLNKALAIVEQ